jgi:hypothetical protein
MPVPSEFCSLTSLRDLSLGFNGLDEVPQAVQGLRHLTRLSLEGNRLGALADGPYLTGELRGRCALLGPGLACRGGRRRRRGRCPQAAHVAATAPPALVPSGRP